MAYRLAKINELIRQEMGNILLKEGDIEPGVLVTILKVTATDDLKNADILFSVWPNEKAEKINAKLKIQAGWLQSLLNKRVKFHPVPRIKFVLNTEEVEGQKIDAMIKKLSQE